MTRPDLRVYPTRVDLYEVYVYKMSSVNDS